MSGASAWRASRWRPAPRGRRCPPRCRTSRAGWRPASSSLLDHREFRERNEGASLADLVDFWIAQERQALADGFSNLRITGNASWLERRDWGDFMEYEAAINQRFGTRRIVGMCSYQLQRCQSEDVLDVVRNHRFALTRRAGNWELVESSSLLVAKEELRRLNAGLEDRVEQRTRELQAALNARDEFLSVASHELKTPLATLELHLDALLRKGGRGETFEREALLGRLAKTRQQCDRLHALVEELLDVSRAQHGRYSLQLEEFDLARLATEVGQRLSPQLERAGCRLRVRAERPVVGHWDRARIDRAITNLLSNAAQHAPGAEVDFAVEERADHVSVTVADDGPGIPAEDRPHLFERFVDLGQRRRSSGLGLGLWIVRQTALLHCGEVRFSNARGGGSRFEMVLPRNPDPDSSLQEPECPPAASSSWTTTPTSATPSKSS
ncbi:MAG: ATP-binding protein [Myxococcales bacterium]